MNKFFCALLGLGLAMALPLASAQSAKNAATKTQTASKTQAASAKPICLVANFRTLALETYHPEERSTKTEAWLKANGADCSVDQILIIRSNRAHWLGNADSASLMGMVDAIAETKLRGQPQLLAQLYGAQGVENKASTETTSTTPNAAALPPKPSAPAVPIAAVVVAPAVTAAKP
jgi:hypothetical protein